MIFSVRSNESELIDNDDLSYEEISRNMQELEIINSLLGGHRISIQGIKLLIGENPLRQHPLIICEIGCGGGNNLQALSKWCSKRKLDVAFVGVDINPYCIRYANEKNHSSRINFIERDYKEVVFDTKPDIIFSSLFCHHFTNSQLIEMLKWLKQHSGTGFFINDLHRHPLAYYSISVLTRLLSKSRLVKNDAPLSVLRGFQKKEWKHLLKESGISQYTLQWKWAFRWLVAAKNYQASPK